MRASFVLISCILVSEHLRNLAIYFCFMFRAHQRAEWEAVSLAVERLGCLIVGWSLLASGHGVLVLALVYLGARGASLCVAAAIYYRKLHQVSLSWDPETVKVIHREFRPLTVVLISDRLSMYIPPVLLTILVGEYATGIFQAAFKTIMPAVLLSAAITGSLYPVMAVRYVKDKFQCARLYYSVIRSLLHLLLPGAAILLVFAHDVCRVLFGPQFRESARILQVLTPYCVSMAVIPASVLLMPATDHQKTGSVLSAIGLSLNFIFGLVLIRYFGVMGAGIALSFAQVVMVVLYLVIASRYLAERINIRMVMADFAAFLVSYLGLVMLSSHSPQSRLATLLAASALSWPIYFATLFVQRALSEQERFLFGKLIRTRLAPVQD